MFWRVYGKRNTQAETSSSDYLETFIDSCNRLSFVPIELVNIMAYTGETGKEIGIYINRRNRVSHRNRGRQVCFPHL